MKYINRNIESKLLEMSKQFSVIMVTGPRQVGKTTMLNYISREIYKDLNYISLDNLNNRILAIEDPELFLETFKAPLIVDEFQYAPNLLSYIKIKVDNEKMNSVFNESSDIKTMYYLTGSQSFVSMKNVTESLAGRVGIIDMYGLSTREINNSSSEFFNPEIDELQKRINKKDNYTMQQIFQRIFKGSYPELYINKDISLENYFEGYIRTYIERDIRDLVNVVDEIKFMKFITALAARTGQEINYSEIANEIGISVPTVNDWLSILVNTGLVVFLDSYSTNVIKRVVKRPKLYFMDTGLACYLTKYPNAEILENSAYAGAIFETYVVSEIIKSFANAGLNYKRYLYYYRDNNGHEIDIIIEYNNKLYPVEIKKAKQPDKTAIKHFSVLNGISKDVGNGIVLCMINEVFPIDKNNYYVPISCI